jgi:IS5 family transposase
MGPAKVAGWPALLHVCMLHEKRARVHACMSMLEAHRVLVYAHSGVGGQGCRACSNRKSLKYDKSMRGDGCSRMMTLHTRKRNRQARTCDRSPVCTAYAFCIRNNAARLVGPEPR